MKVYLVFSNKPAFLICECLLKELTDLGLTIDTSVMPSISTTRNVVGLLSSNQALPSSGGEDARPGCPSSSRENSLDGIPQYHSTNYAVLHKGARCWPLTRFDEHKAELPWHKIWCVVCVDG